MGYSARVLADSVTLDGDRLTTVEATFPRIILAELNTHRDFSRNSASSRAIPVAKRIASVEAAPFVPTTFGRNQKGMSASEDLARREAAEAEFVWRTALGYALQSARALEALDVHKQLANRLLEPFSWHTAIISATQWDNFFGLRCSPEAQPEIRTIAEMIEAARAASVPRVVEPGDWHLPLCPDREELAGLFGEEAVPMVAVGRCARVSYLTHDGRRDPRADLDLAARLRSNGHLSPFEHVARPLDGGARCGNFVGWLQYRKQLPMEDNFRALQASRALAKSTAAFDAAELLASNRGDIR